MKATLEKLKSDILDRYSSVHAFCRVTEGVSRSSVYQVLAGKYPGDLLKQIQRIRAALAGIKKIPEKRPVLTAEDAYTILQESKCSHCRKQDKRACRECQRQTEREVQALANYLHSQEAV